MKKIFAVAVLSALSSVAMADVTLYGNVEGTVERTKGNSTVVHSDGSYIGFKGSESLNPNLKAIWQFEQGIDLSSNDTRDYNFKESTRDSFIGLKMDGVGKVSFGKQTLPYVKMVQGMDLNREKNTTLLGNYGRTDRVRNNASALIETDSFAGFSAGVGYAAEDKGFGLAEKTKTVSTSVNYDNGTGVIGGVAYEQARDFVLADDKRQNVAGQVGYRFANGAKVLGGYEHLRYQAVNKVKQDVASVTATMPIDKFELGANYTRAFESKVNGVENGGKANIYTAQAKYNLSNRTSVGANYSYIDNSNGSAYTFRNDTGVTNFGDSKSSYGVTLKHEF